MEPSAQMLCSVSYCTWFIHIYTHILTHTHTHTHIHTHSLSLSLYVSLHTPKVVDAFAKAVAESDVMQTFDISLNDVRDRGASRLAKYVTHCTRTMYSTFIYYAHFRKLCYGIG